MGNADDDWIRDRPAVRKLVFGGAKRCVDAWDRVPGLLEAGTLSEEARGWYRVNDFRAAMQAGLGHVISAMEMDESGALKRVKLEKPSPDMRAWAARPGHDH